MMRNEELCALAQNSGGAVEEQLIEGNMPFVAAVAGKMYAQFKGLVEFDELLQEGRIAVWRCIGKFDDEKEVAFLTYTGRAVRNAMVELVRKRLTVVEVEGECFDECAENGVDGDDFRFPESALLHKERIKDVLAALGEIEPRYREYLRLRFGFVDGTEHTTTEAARYFSIGVGRARKLERAALEKLRGLLE